MRHVSKWIWRASLALALLVVILGLLIRAFGWDWTGLQPDVGLPGYSHISLVQPAKTLWDWLQLIIVPLMLLAIGIWFDRRDKARDAQQRQVDHSRAETQREAQQRIENDRHQEAMLDSYLDRMSALLLDKSLRHTRQGDEAQSVAQAWTLTALRRLDVPRKTVLVRFLADSGLLHRAHKVIDLSNTDLSGIVLHDAELRGVDLSHAILAHADLTGANLAEADLHECDFSEAILNRAKLSGADLTKAQLRGAFLSEADLSDSVFKNAYMSAMYGFVAGPPVKEENGVTYLAPATLQKYWHGPNLYGTNLTQADLTDAPLNRANLRNANLTRTVIADWQLKSAESIEGSFCEVQQTHNRPQGSV